MIMAHIAERFERAPKDTVGLEFIGEEIRAVRLRLSANGPQLAGTEDLEKVEFGPRGSLSSHSPLSKRMRSRAGSLAFHSPHMRLKVLTFPASHSADIEQKLTPAMGIESPADYRISHRVLSHPQNKQELRVLCVAVPREQTQRPLRFCHSGYPAPYSLECAGLAAFSALEYHLGDTVSNTSYGSIHFGTETTVAGLFHRGTLGLIRQIPFGARQLYDSVSKHLGLTAETARQIVEDPSFDISEAVSSLLPPVISNSSSPATSSNAGKTVESAPSTFRASWQLPVLFWQRWNAHWALPWNPGIHSHGSTVRVPS